MRPPRNYGHHSALKASTHTYLLYAWAGFGHVKLNLSHITQWTSLDHHTFKVHRHATHNYPSIPLFLRVPRYLAVRERESCWLECVHHVGSFVKLRKILWHYHVASSNYPSVSSNVSDTVNDPVALCVCGCCQQGWADHQGRVGEREARTSAKGVRCSVLTSSSPSPTSLIALSLTVQGYDDPQTEADRRAQRCIVASLSSQFPNITIIGEEVGRLHAKCIWEKSLSKLWGTAQNKKLGSMLEMIWS